jgi:hypothetical protein
MKMSLEKIFFLFWIRSEDEIYRNLRQSSPALFSGQSVHYAIHLSSLKNLLIVYVQGLTSLTPLIFEGRSRVRNAENTDSVFRKKKKKNIVNFKREPNEISRRDSGRKKKPSDDPLFRAKQFERLSLRGLVPLNGKTVHVDFGLKNHGI